MPKQKYLTLQKRTNFISPLSRTILSPLGYPIKYLLVKLIKDDHMSTKKKYKHILWVLKQYFKKGSISERKFSCLNLLINSESVSSNIARL